MSVFGSLIATCVMLCRAPVLFVTGAQASVQRRLTQGHCKFETTPGSVCNGRDNASEGERRERKRERERARAYLASTRGRRRARDGGTNGAGAKHESTYGITHTAAEGQSNTEAARARKHAPIIQSNDAQRAWTYAVLVLFVPVKLCSCMHHT